ncbi:hypothetical protein GOEFS_037_00260 [Gordonia effusa NBRC 100432]|uniref:Uncharacterized protein n=1 Tax=Gordonia effusa NBRC 100432 TaxID=1077974 RepID=H0QY22_9ACTN|nr:hypothetical protein [Gordonia effusa]GAB17723.1 hypothetical protein GOEFS_037_00260 [Gordonia effusa NBRC 100432]
MSGSDPHEPDESASPSDRIDALAVDNPPGSVIAAGAVLIGFGVFGGVLRMFLTDPHIIGYGSRMGGLVVVVASLLAVVAGGKLLNSRWRGYAVFGTVVAGLLAVTGIGIVATVAVPILLWRRDSARAWFAPQPHVPLPPQ